MSEYRLSTRELREFAPRLRAGDRVLLSGTIYTARDAAHKRLFALLGEGKPLPLPLEGAVIYYAGPTPAQQGMAVGACGPTTASRMNGFAPRLLDLGLRAIIGKGEMSAQVQDALKRSGSCYFAAVGGAGALIKNSVVKNDEVIYEDLGCEAMHELTVVDLPLLVGIDCNDLENLPVVG